MDESNLLILMQGKHIYERGSKNGKRVQCNMGAKNHGVVLPDANKETSLNQIIGAAFGAAGQRCMALSVAIFVGEAKNWLPDLKAKAEKLKVNFGKIKYFKTFFYCLENIYLKIPLKVPTDHIVLL